MTRILDDDSLESSPVVANCAMNRERSLTGSNGYQRELGLDVMAELTGDRFDLITCVHGLHYIGDKLGALTRAASWLTDTGTMVANFDTGTVRLRDGTAAGRRLTAHLRRQGFTYHPARHRISRRGPQAVHLPYRYLGADDRAGPNYTGQDAIDSYYEPQH
jgi:hypothetical protein